MDFDYKIFGSTRDITNANASAVIYHSQGKSNIYLHPSKCSNCKSYFDDIEYQTITGINHEVQESLVVEILQKDMGKYENKWFDETCTKWSNTTYQHSCKGLRGIFIPHTETLNNCGYFR